MKASIAKQHRHIDVRAQHALAALTRHQAHIHLWISLMKALQPWHQPERRKGKVGGDLQHFALAAPAGLGNTVIHGLQPLMHLFEQHLASLGQLDAPVNAVKQARAQLCLQALHLLAHCRLRGTQLQRRSGKATQARSSLEYAQGIQRQPGKVLKHKLG
ncbi:hypothetical protein D9M72_15460 [compost metagenome]